MAEKRPKRRLRNYLLDSRFQLKYTLAVVVVAATVAAGLGTKLYQAHRESSQVIGLDPEFADLMSVELAQKDRRVLIVLSVFLGGLVVAMTGLGIIFTHKIAGPAFNIRRTLSLVADGELPFVRGVRKGDELREVAEEVKRMVDTLREREKTERDLLLRIATELTDGQASPEQAGLRLKDLVESKTARLGDDEDAAPASQPGNT